MKINKRFKPELCVSKDPERFQLHDPYLDVKEGRLFATDGAMLVSLPVETDVDERSRYIAAPLCKVARQLGDKLALAEIVGDEIRPSGVLWPLEDMGKKFPPVTEVIPKFRPGDPGTITIGIDARRLRKLADAIGAEGQVWITKELDPSATNGPVLVTLEGDVDEFAVLMPLRPIVSDVGPNQKCPKCEKLLAAGAWCKEHGDPRAEAMANEMLRRAGNTEMTKSDLAGPAVARVPKKKG